MNRLTILLLLFSLIVVSCTVVFGDSNKVDVRVNRELDIDSTVGDVATQKQEQKK